MKITLKEKAYLAGVLHEAGAMLEIGTEIDSGLAAVWVSHRIAIYGSDTDEQPTPAVAAKDPEIETAAVEPVVEKAKKKRGRPRKVWPKKD